VYRYYIFDRTGSRAWHIIRPILIDRIEIMCPLRITRTPHTPHQYHTLILLYTARDQNRAKSVQITTVTEYNTYIIYIIYRISTYYNNCFNATVVRY